MTTIVNLTPHPIRVRKEDGSEVVFEPSGKVPRLSTVEKPAGDVNGIPCIKRKFGGVENLPEKKEGTMYIVSSLIKEAVPNRDDLLAPDTGKSCIRDSDGRIIAVTQFIR